MKDTKCLHIQISAELIKRLVAELSSTALKVYKQKMTNSRTLPGRNDEGECYRLSLPLQIQVMALPEESQLEIRKLSFDFIRGLPM